MHLVTEMWLFSCNLNPVYWTSCPTGKSMAENEVCSKVGRCDTISSTVLPCDVGAMTQRNIGGLKVGPKDGSGDVERLHILQRTGKRYAPKPPAFETAAASLGTPTLSSYRSNAIFAGE